MPQARCFPDGDPRHLFHRDLIHGPGRSIALKIRRFDFSLPLMEISHRREKEVQRQFRMIR